MRAGPGQALSLKVKSWGAGLGPAKRSVVDMVYQADTLHKIVIATSEASQLCLMCVLLAFFWCIFNASQMVCIWASSTLQVLSGQESKMTASERCETNTMSGARA